MSDIDIDATPDTVSAQEMPARLVSADPACIVDVDVREDLRSGREPFARIMEARRGLARDGVLRVRAIFEPYPLYTVLGRQGLEHWTECLADDDWRIWFYRGDGRDVAGEPAQPAGSPIQAAVTSAVADATDAESEALPDGAAVLDVRGLEPPEPMVRTLAAVERLGPGDTLVQINERIPRFLLPHLEERGFAYHIRQQDPHLVRVFIRRREAPTP